jgi:hypothetical protein
MRNSLSASPLVLLAAVLLANGCVVESGDGFEGVEDDIEVGTASEALTFSTRPSLGGLGTQGPSLPTPSKCDVAFANCVDGCNAWGTWLGEEFVDRCTFSCEEQRIDCRFPGGPVDPFPT